MNEETNLPDSGEQPLSRFVVWYRENKVSRAEYMKEYRERNRETVRRQSRESSARRRKEVPEYFMLHNAKTRAKKRQEPCTITVEDIVIPERCPILGIPLAVNTGLLGPGSPSLDRFDPSLGYVPGNVWVISHRANSMKNDASPEELRQFCTTMLNILNAKETQ